MAIKLYLLQGDITTADVDAIVNSANNDLILGAGVSGAIRRVGGPQIQEECNTYGTIPLGEAVITTGGQLKCRWIIHAAVQPLGLWSDLKSVRNGLRNTLKRANEKKIKSIAIPAIGCGAGAFPVDHCADLMFAEITEHGKGPTSLEAVIFVLFDEKYYKAFEEQFKLKFPDQPVEAPPLQIPRVDPAGAAAS